MCEGEPRGDSLVRGEEATHEMRAIAFLAAMQEHDVIRQATRAVEQLAQGCERLEVREVAAAAHDALLQKQGARTLGLHLRIVIALQGDAVEIAEAVEKGARNVTEISGVADAIVEPIDDEPVRPEFVVRKANRLASHSGDRREGRAIEWSDQMSEIGRASGQAADLVQMTVDRDFEAQKG